MTHAPSSPRPRILPSDARPTPSAATVPEFATVSPAPVVIGTGLVALDVVYGLRTPHQPFVAAGGTCGNVLAALAYLGWLAYPVARLANDGAGEVVRSDLSRWGVRLDFVGMPSTTGAPVMVQRIRQDADGHITHKFSLGCRECGRWLPTYQPVSGASVEAIMARLPLPEVCFVDRASAGAVRLAEWAAAQGALVYVEPSGRSTPELLGRLIACAHVLKYSADHAELVERARSTAFARHAAPVLEIETLGPAGLRYRAAGARGWRRCRALPVDRIADSAGAGDWCTAGVLHALGQGGAAALEHAPLDVVEDGIRFGQALGAWTCGFEGARGGMYAGTIQQFRAAVTSILSGATAPVAATEAASQSFDATPDLCRDCSAGADRSVRVQ
jgi:sugar/nucleoside kinase (ribokinase family)